MIMRRRGVRPPTLQYSIGGRFRGIRIEWEEEEEGLQ